MKKIILILLIILMLSMVNASAYSFYNLSLEHDKGKINIRNIEFISAKENLLMNGTTYSAKTISFEGKILNNYQFDIRTKIIYESFDFETGSVVNIREIELNKTNFTLYLPYLENAKSIEIYSPNITKLLTIDVSQFSKNLCGDGICQSYESAESCPSDCEKPAPKGIKAKEEPLEQILGAITETASNTRFWVAIASVILVILIIRIILKKKPQGTLPTINPDYPKEA